MPAQLRKASRRRGSQNTQRYDAATNQPATGSSSSCPRSLCAEMSWRQVTHKAYFCPRSRDRKLWDFWWFSRRTPSIYHTLFLGIGLVEGSQLKFKYYLTNWFNQGNTAADNTQPYANFDANVFHPSHSVSRFCAAGTSITQTDRSRRGPSTATRTGKLRSLTKIIRPGNCSHRLPAE